MDITNNEIQFVLLIFKSPEIEYNANSIAKKLGISAMGALKIAKRTEKDNVVTSKTKGKAKFYKLNLGNEYTRQYIKFLLKREAEQSPSYIKRWVNDIRNIKNADCAVLFGSLLRKGKNANDIDILLITDNKKFQKLKKEIEEINYINIKKIHPMYQTKDDVKNNIKKEDKPLLNALKGIVVFGEDTLMGVLTS
ncbi:nucleotidyltransferase domain-containing protein [Candidatus Woesearchaeota archaeon]|nr:nucleotidyltransferase domain-containing protein [Candidatus Woesearchaeota archaeon]